MKHVFIALLFLISHCDAHEINENRANVTIRENRTGSVSLYLNITNLLARDDHSPTGAFELIAQMSTISDSEFEVITSQLFEKIENNIQLIVNHKDQAVLSWRRPEQATLRAHFKGMLMDAVVQKNQGEGQHFHERPFQWVSFFVSPQAIKNIELKVNLELFPMTVVVSRLTQRSAKASGDQLTFDFSQDQ
jgi:hypothetical protein